ncbi:MAG: Rne/Rng family ribonuclease [Thermoclostridium sp.]|nr:Rne/Rng family ribonuclease [Thermoclostridium sp.]
MIKDILVDVKPEQTRVAIMEDGELAEIYMDSPEHKKLIGNIYRGKVERVLPGMQCAFVDIGLDKNAFLYAGDIFTGVHHELNESNPIIREPVEKIENLIRQGQEITVQVIKEAIESKGPRVTTNIALPGRNTVLCPYSPGVGVSKKIQQPEERERLKGIAEKLCPAGMGLIIRTAAQGIEKYELEDDILLLQKLWEKVKEKESKGSVPRCLYSEPDLVQKLARDLLNAGVRRFVVNDRDEYESLLELLEDISPNMKIKVEYYCGEYELFDFYHVESAIQKALARKVWMKCGGYVVFDKTEALTVIDVNTGKFTGRDDQEQTILLTNLEATIAIARQIRLRDISGIILIDFIDMQENENKEQVLSSLKEAVKQDGTRTVVVGMTRLGLVEMTRKKVRNNLQHTLTEPCPACGGTGRKTRK